MGGSTSKYLQPNLTWRCYYRITFLLFIILLCHFFPIKIILLLKKPTKYTNIKNLKVLLHVHVTKTADLVIIKT